MNIVGLLGNKPDPVFLRSGPPCPQSKPLPQGGLVQGENGSVFCRESRLEAPMFSSGWPERPMSITAIASCPCSLRIAPWFGERFSSRRSLTRPE